MLEQYRSSPVDFKVIMVGALSVVYDDAIRIIVRENADEGPDCTPYVQMLLR